MQPPVEIFVHKSYLVGLKNNLSQNVSFCHMTGVDSDFFPCPPLLCSISLQDYFKAVLLLYIFLGNCENFVPWNLSCDSDLLEIIRKKRLGKGIEGRFVALQRGALSQRRGSLVLHPSFLSPLQPSFWAFCLFQSKILTVCHVLVKG